MGSLLRGSQPIHRTDQQDPVATEQQVQLLAHRREALGLDLDQPPVAHQVDDEALDRLVCSITVMAIPVYERATCRDYTVGDPTTEGMAAPYMGTAS